MTASFQRAARNGGASQSRAAGARHIIFLHIPKTAGMSMHGLFVRNYRGKGIHNMGVRNICESEWLEAMERVRRMAPSELERIRVFKGHMIFGLHELLPGPSTYITFLRDPVSRIVSHYRMICGHGALAPGHVMDPSKPFWNFETYPDFHRALDNYQVRAISGVDFEVPFGACSAEHLAMAKANLDRHFAFVGLTEQFDLSLMLLRREFGWGWRYYVADNVGTVSGGTIAPETIEQLRHLNRLDFELHEYARERLEKLVARSPWRIRAEHQVFRLGNAVHLRLHRARRRLKGLRDGSKK